MRFSFTFQPSPRNPHAGSLALFFAAFGLLQRGHDLFFVMPSLWHADPPCSKFEDLNCLQ